MSLMRAARAVVRRTPLEALARRVARRLRDDALLREDFVPYDTHVFDRHVWVIKEMRSGARLWCSLDDRAISRPILLDRYELAESRFIARTVRPGDRVVDAGANIGYHTVHLARLVGADGRVDAFEPLPYLADALGASLAENGVVDRVRVHRSALDERPNSVVLRHAPRTANFGGAHLTRIAEVPPGHVDAVVTATTLDDVVAGGPCAFVKIDIEGAEPRAMRGATKLLSSLRPIVLSELHDAQLRAVSASSANDYIEQMAGFGYRCSSLAEDGSIGASIERYADSAPLNVVFEPN